MNIVDYVVLGIVGISVLFGVYRGFLSSMLNTGGCILSLYLSYQFYPKLAVAIQSNGSLVRTLLHYTDASSRIGDLELALTNVGTLTAEKIAEILGKVNLPPPFDTLLQVNLEQHIYSVSGITSVSDYVSQTILGAAVNILCFVVCFVVIYFVVSMVVNFLRSIFRFPLLKRLDGLAGGLFGLARGLLICYVCFAFVPLVQTMVPLELISSLLAESTLAPLFNNGNMVLSIMNGHL